MSSIAETVCQRLNRGESVVLACITGQQGSTPRTTGTRMVVVRDGAHFGTIGGGLLEGRVIERGRKLLAGGDAYFVSFDLGKDELAGEDMVCGGGLEVMLDPLAPTPENLALFERWRTMAAEGQSGLFVTCVSRSADDVKSIDHALLNSEGEVFGSLPLTEEDLAALGKTAGTDQNMNLTTLGAYFVITTPIRSSLTVIIVGAGHVAKPTAHLASVVGFDVVVIDDREAFANRERFPDARQIIVRDDLTSPFDQIAVDRQSFIVIVTRGHRSDKEVLAAALGTEAGYIGMIGSRRKRETIFKQLIDEGVSQEALQQVYSPIGLNIGAETPEEIALSIVGEMIQVRRGLPGNSK